MPDTFTDEEIGLTPLSDEDIGLKQLAADELKRQTLEARIEGQQAKAIQTLANVGEGASYWIADALAKVDPTGIANQMLARQGVPRTPPILKPEDVDTALEVVKKGLHIPETAPAEGKLGQVTRGLSEAGKEMVVGFTDPGMLAGLGLAKAAPQEGAKLFQYQLMGSLPATTEQALQAQNLEEAVKGGVGVAANVAFPIALNPAAAGPRIRIPEDFKVEPIQLRPEAAPVKKVAQEAPKFEEKPATEPSILAPEKPEVTAAVESEKPNIIEALQDSIATKLTGLKSDIENLKSAQKDLQGKEVEPVEKPVEESAKPAVETKPRQPITQDRISALYKAEHSDLIELQKRIEEARSDPEALKQLEQEKADSIQRLSEFDKLYKQGDTSAIKWEDSPELASVKAIRQDPTLTLPQAEIEGARLRKRDIENRIYDAEEEIPKAAYKEYPDLKPKEAKPAEPLSDEQIGLTAESEAPKTSHPFEMTFPQWMNKGERQIQLTRIPEVSQPTRHQSVKLSVETLNGPKQIKATTYYLPGYRGPEIAVQEYSSKRSATGKGYCVYLKDSGELLQDSNGVGSLNDTLKIAVQRLSNYQQKTGRSAFQLVHQQIVQRALREGKPVPAEVLADYPDLQPSPKPAEAPVEAVATSKLEQLTAKVESGQKLTASEKKQYLKLRQEATGAAPEAEKPIVGMGGAAIGETNPKTQIEQLTEAAQGVTPKKLPLGERFKQDIDLTRKREILAEGATKAIGALRDTWNGIKNRWNGIENVDDLLREKGKLSAEIETRGWRVRKFESEMKKAVPSKRDRAAISKWVDAGGDLEMLKRGALETKPEYRQAYIDALDLRGDLLTTAQNARSYFEARLNEAIDAGVLKEGVEDYIHRVYESRPEVAKKVFANVQTGLLQRNPNLAKKRVFDFDFEAEKLGYKPVQSFIDRIALYESSLSKAIAAREFIKKATEMKADDGRPVIDIKGVGIPVENAEGVREGTLIKPKFNPQLNNEPGSPNYRGDYVNKEFPSLSRWKWVSTDAGGKPIFVQGDVAIHPDFVHRINALLEPSRLRYGRYSKITRPMLDVGSAVKQTMLDLSGFHQVQITAHGLEHKVLPWKIVKDIDFNNPNVEGLLKGGITLGGDYRAAYKEGLVGNSITRHVPWLGPVLDSYHQWLFQSYIPRIKMTMALQALERNRIRYGKTMTDEQILHKTASQANSAFGELNYIMLERSKTTQDIARLILLAPDFLEARGRFAGEAFTKGGESKVPGFGNEQRAALLLGALTMYVTARIANKIVDDQYHFEPENAFSLVYKGHAYSLRTVQGDILHLIENPLQFWLNRLNPVYGRTMLEIVTGRDYFGRKRSVPEVLWDSVKNVMPISLRNSRERKLWESMMNSFGVNARRYNATDDAFKLANAWKEKNGIQERGEFIYDAEKDPLRGLKIALSQEDDAGAAKEIKKIFDSKVYDRKRLDAYFKRYASMPFTGSKANDIKFIKSLNEDERKTVEAAKQHKRDMLKLYDQALQKYYAALRTPIQ